MHICMSVAHWLAQSEGPIHTSRIFILPLDALSRLYFR